MKFIDNFKLIKKDYVYRIVDLVSSRYILVHKNIDNKKIMSKDILTGEEMEFPLFGNISWCQETNPGFSDIKDYAFYEIGHKDNLPEYFL